VRLSPLGTSATIWPIVPTPGDECGAVNVIETGRGNRGTRRKPIPVSLCPPQIPNSQSKRRNKRVIFLPDYMASNPRRMYSLTVLIFMWRHDTVQPVTENTELTDPESSHERSCNPIWVNSCPPPPTALLHAALVLRLALVCLSREKSVPVFLFRNRICRPAELTELRPF
jgi:hypothetical protein